MLDNCLFINYSVCNISNSAFRTGCTFHVFRRVVWSVGMLLIEDLECVVIKGNFHAALIVTTNSSYSIFSFQPYQEDLLSVEITGMDDNGDAGGCHVQHISSGLHGKSLHPHRRCDVIKEIIRAETEYVRHLRDVAEVSKVFDGSTCCGCKK